MSYPEVHVVEVRTEVVEEDEHGADQPADGFHIVPLGQMDNQGTHQPPPAPTYDVDKAAKPRTSSFSKQWTWSIYLDVLVATLMAMGYIFIGFYTLDMCPIEPLLPWMLVALGTLWLKAGMSEYITYRRADEDMAALGLWLDFVLLLVFHIGASYVVYSIWDIVQYDQIALTTATTNMSSTVPTTNVTNVTHSHTQSLYCNELMYDTSGWVIWGSSIALGFWVVYLPFTLVSDTK